MTKSLLSNGHRQPCSPGGLEGENRLMVKSVLCLEWSLAHTGTYHHSACRQHDVSPFLINGGLARHWPGLGQPLEQK